MRPMPPWRRLLSDSEARVEEVKVDLAWALDGSVVVGAEPLVAATAEGAMMGYRLLIVIVWLAVCVLLRV